MSSRYTIETYADSYGDWHALITTTDPTTPNNATRRAARRAILKAITERDPHADPRAIRIERDRRGDRYDNPQAPTTVTRRHYRETIPEDVKAVRWGEKVRRAIIEATN